MTKEERDYTKGQLMIIDEKMDEDTLMRYSALLSAAHMSEKVKQYLKRAVTKKMEELNAPVPVVVSADFD